MPENAGPLGSAYLLSQVGGLEEAERLRRQATMVLAEELAILVAALPQGGTCLDIGCGAGLLADALARARPDARVIGVDADAMAVSEAQRVFGGQANLSFHTRAVAEGPGPELPQADVAVMRLVLMHLPNPVHSLRQVRPWVRPGGRLHVIEGDDRGMEFTPSVGWAPSVLDLMERVQIQRGGSRRLGQDLAFLLTQAGWKVMETRLSVPDPAMAAMAFAKVFLPVARFHLAQARKAGLIHDEALQLLQEGMEKQAQKGFESIRIPLHHTWAS